MKLFINYFILNYIVLQHQLSWLNSSFNGVEQ